MGGLRHLQAPCGDFVGRDMLPGEAISQGSHQLPAVPSPMVVDSLRRVSRREVVGYGSCLNYHVHKCKLDMHHNLHTRVNYAMRHFLSKVWYRFAMAAKVGVVLTQSPVKIVIRS